MVWEEERRIDLRKKGEPGGDLSGFLDQDTAIKGDISFKDTLRIDGTFEGSIRAGKHLVVGEGAKVDAEIEVGSIYVSGQLKGRVKASERVELHRSARVESEVITPVLVVEEGAVFEGKCSMIETGAASPRPLEREASVKKFISST